MTGPTSPTVPSSRPASDTAWYALTPDEVAKRLHVDPAAGVTSAAADARRSTDGAHTFDQARKASRWQTFSRQYADPMQIVLLVAGVVCLFLPGKFSTGVFLIVLTLFNAWVLLVASGLSVLTIFLAVEFDVLHRLLGTVSLTIDQWAICIVVSLSLVVVEEVRKLLKVRTGDEPAATSSAPVAVAA